LVAHAAARPERFVAGLAQAANHVISARNLVAGDIPSLATSILTSGTLETARLRRGAQIVLCAGFTPAGTGADTAEFLVPFDPADGVTSITWTVRRISLRVRVAGGAPVAVVEKSSAGDAVFGSATTVGPAGLDATMPAPLMAPVGVEPST
jgi:hypothetical protein